MTRPEDIPQHAVDAATKRLSGVVDPFWAKALPFAASDAIAAALDALMGSPEFDDPGWKTPRAAFIAVSEVELAEHRNRLAADRMA